YTVTVAKGDETLAESQQIVMAFDARPIHPVQRIVLAIRIVIPLLRPANLIAHQQHRHALAEEQHRQGILYLPLTQAENFRIGRGTLSPAIPRMIVIRAVAIVLA